METAHAGLFEVAAVSDPGMALAPTTPMWLADLRALTQYDVNLVKPALLIADRVALKTYRQDMMTLLLRDANQINRMPMRAIWFVIHFAAKGDAAALERLGLQQSQLPSRADALALLESHTDDPDLRWEQVKAFERKHEQRVRDVLAAASREIRGRRDSLLSDELEVAEDAGLLVVEGWANVQASPYELSWIEPEQLMAASAVSLVEYVANSPRTLLFEPGAAGFLARGGSEKGVQARRMETPLDDLPARIATALIGKLASLDNVPMAELIEVREDLEDYLPPFRASVMELATEIASTGEALSGEMLAQELDRRWHRDVSPALSELDYRVKAGSYPRQLIDAFSQDKASLAATASSLVLAAGSVVAGISALLPAAAAAAVPFVRSLNEQLKVRDEVRRNHLYFMYQARRRLRD